MGLRPYGGDGSGGGGFALGPSPNTFGTVATATMAAARALLDAQASGDAAWLALYDANRSNYARLVWTGNATAILRRNAAGDDWENVTGLVVGPPGLAGTAGAPGGGAIVPTGVIYDGTGARAANEFVAPGVLLGERGDTPYLLYRIVPSTLALLWFSTDGLYDVARAAAGDTSTDGSTGPPVVLRNRMTLPESAGSSIAGSLAAGLSLDGELLLSTSSANVDITLEFFRYEPSAAQGGLTDTERAELTALAAANWVQSVTAAGSTITITRRDGTVTQHTFPMGGGMGGGSDGVLDEAPVFDEAAQIVTFHISTGAEFALNLADLVTQTELDAAINGLANQTNAEVKASYEANPDTNPFPDASAAKLAGVAAGANQLIPYKIGNIYRAVAAGTVPAKPSNVEGEVTVAGITVAPAGWLLARPEATEALPHVFDCHVYGYQTNGVFGWQFGSPNRTDRWIAPGGHRAPNDDLYLGTSADAVPEAAELTIPAVNGVGTIAAYDGHRHHVIARLASEGDIAAVFYSDDPSMDNALGAYAMHDQTLVPPGETENFNVWITNQALTNTADVEVTVR